MRTRPLARRDRAAARHQQLPGVHRPAVPRAVRGVVRARHQPGPGDHQAGRGRDHRQRLRRGLGGAAAAGQADRQEGRRRRLRSGRAGRRAAADPRRAHRHVFERADRIGGLLRYGIPEFKMEKRHIDRRLAQMEAEGTAVPHRRQRRRRHHRRRSCGPTSTPWCWPAARPHGATCRFPAATWTASTRRWSSCRGPTGCSRATPSSATTASRRSRRRARRSSSSAAATPARTAWAPSHRQGADERAPVRDHAPAAGGARRLDAVADLPADVSGCRPPTKRAASGCSR